MDIRQATFPRQDLVESLLARRMDGRAKVITGLRRAGKSHLLFHLLAPRLREALPEEIEVISLNFDDEEEVDSALGGGSSSLRTKDGLVSAGAFLAFLRKKTEGGGRVLFLLDEIQELERFPNLLISILSKGSDAYVTGSNARFLSRDIATEFRGRGEAFFVPPLSLKETMDGLALPFEEALSLYLSYGGLPYAALLSSPEEKEAYLQSLFRETYVRDLLERNAIRREDSFRRLLSVATSSVGSCLSPSRIEKTFRSELHSPYSRETIGRHLRLMEDAFLIEEATRVDLRGRKAISSSSKYYFGDLGILNAALQGKRLGFGRALENLVYLAFRKRGWTVHVGNIALSKERQGDSRYAEVDFLLEKPGRRAYAQLFAGIPGEKDEERELRPLLHVPDSFPKAFLSMDPRAPSYDDHGILHLSLRDFLLEGDRLGF